MLVARAQLDFVKQLVARFERPENTLQPIIVFQSQYIAIIALLRSVGHVFEKVDCDYSPTRKAWCQSQWAQWKKASIFTTFIEPKRNDLLKQFKGGLELSDNAFDPLAFVADPAMPDGISAVTAMDAKRLRDGDGRLVILGIHDAIAFWDNCLSRAEVAFQEPAN